MRDNRIQYFLTYAVLGTVVPYASVFFISAGLTRLQIGYAYAIWSMASVFSPALVTLLADGKHDPRRLLAAASLISGTALAAMTAMKSPIAIYACWTIYCLGSMPIFPLMDGIHFSQQRRRLEQGESVRPYHLVRVWGTIGYIAPNLLLFEFLRRQCVDLKGVLISGAVISAIAALQAGWLLDPRPRTPDAGDNLEARDRAPTFAAAAALFKPHFLAFTIAVVLMNMSASVLSAFYPVYLTERVGLSHTWLGVTAIIATFFETFVLFGCGWMISRGGLKKLFILSILGMALRMTLLGSSTQIAIAIWTQALHGFLVLAVAVLPQAIFDESAEDRYRHSMQGVLVMVTYAGRGAISLLAGRTAEISLRMTFYGAAVMCLIAAVLAGFGFHEHAIRRPVDSDSGDPEKLLAPSGVSSLGEGS